MIEWTTDNQILIVVQVLLYFIQACFKSRSRSMRNQPTNENKKTKQNAKQEAEANAYSKRVSKQT